MNARQRRKQKRRHAAEMARRLRAAARDPLEDALTVWILGIKLEDIKYSETPSGA